MILIYILIYVFVYFVQLVALNIYKQHNSKYYHPNQLQANKMCRVLAVRQYIYCIAVDVLYLMQMEFESSYGRSCFSGSKQSDYTQQLPHNRV